MGLSDEQCAWLTRGLAGAATTVDEAASPTVVRVFAHRLSSDREHLEFCIALSDAERTLRNLAERPLAAVTVVCPRTYRCLLFKGPCRRVDGEPERELLERCLDRCDEALHAIGMNARDAHRFLSHYRDPTPVLISLRIEEVFDQSPGPQAGTKL
jgi:hypothetical protein